MRPHLDFSSYNDKSILTIHNASGGFLEDVGEAYRGKKGYITPPVIEMVMSIKEFSKNNRDAVIHIVAHSQGCIHLKNALRELDQKTRDQLRITAVGPAAYIERELCEHVQHIASKDDLVARYCLMDKTENVVWLDRHPEADGSLMGGGDHAFISPTVKNEVKKRTSKFVRRI